MKPRQRPLSASREAERGRSSVTGRSSLEGGPGVALLLALVCCIPVVVQGHLSYIGDTFYFSQSPQSDKVVEGRPHTLHCNVSDTTNISFSWVKDGETLKRTHRRFMIGASLHMRRVSRFEDNGEYACIAHNMSSGFALTSLPAHLRVVWMGVGSRVMLAEPRSQSQLRKGATVVLRCKVEASSDLDYDWFRNGDALQVGDGISTRSRRLTIVQLGVRHNGMYSCRGRNQAGQTQLQNPFKLTLRGNNAPNIEVAPTIEVAREKDPAWIPCRYDGGTLIEWYHHDHGPLTNSSSYVVFPNGTLKVTSAGKETEGVYKS